MSALRVSVRGQPPRLIPDRDPFLGLSQRQRQILDVVRAFAGNRTRAAHQLGVSISRVQHAIRDCERAGALVPAGARRGPNGSPRPLGPRCALPMPLAVRCGRRAGHGGKCVSVAAWQRSRAA